MTFGNQGMMTQIDFEKVIVDTFVDDVCIETVISSPDFIYDNVAMFYDVDSNSAAFVDLDY